MKSILAILLVTIFMIEILRNMCVDSFFFFFFLGCCDSSTHVNIHRTLCMDLYGCELWNISSKYTEEMHTAWRIAMRKIWKLHPRTHNNLICNIRSNFTHSLEKKDIFLSFIMPCITLMNWSDYYYMLS